MDLVLTKKARNGGSAGGWRLLVSSLIQDLAFAVRTMRKGPMFVTAAVISLGLGIGANTAVFSVINSLLVQPLTVTDPATNGYAGGENLEQVRQRALPALEELMQRHLGQLILVVCHNVVNRVVLATLLDVPLANARGIDQDNCGVNVIRLRDGQLKVMTTNSAFHLR